MNNYEKHALAEFMAAGWLDKNGKFIDEMQEMICKHVMELLNVFNTAGHSGSSAPYAISLFEKLAKFEPITPLTGEDWEWNEMGEGIFQNKRCSHVFKQADRFNGQPYDIDAVIFWEWITDENGVKFKTHYTSRDSMQPITFPYIPTRQYVERASE